MMSLLQDLHHIDQHVTLAMNGCNSLVSDYIWMVFSHKTIWVVLYLAVIYFLFRRLGWKKALVVIASCVLAFAVCDQFANLVKNSVQRLRPCWDLNMVDGGLHLLERKGGQYGFFSAHAASSMCFAVTSLLGFRHYEHCNTLPHRVYAPCIVVWSLLVGISRVFVGKHFLGDVLVGFAVGALVGCLFGWLAGKVMSSRALSAH